MERADIDRLFTLLRELYPRITPKLGRNTKEAWLAVLQPYEYSEVKAQLLAWNRGPNGRTFPDPRECVPPAPEPEQEDGDAVNGPKIYAEDILRICDYLYGFQHHMVDPKPEEYLKDLAEWEQRLDEYEVAEDSHVRDLIRKKREQIYAYMAQQNENGGENDA